MKKKKKIWNQFVDSGQMQYQPTLVVRYTYNENCILIAGNLHELLCSNRLAFLKKNDRILRRVYRYIEYEMKP